MSIPSSPTEPYVPAATVDPFEDFRLPLVLRSAGKVLEPVVRRWWPIEPEVLKRRARAATGLTNFGDLAPLDEPLELLCRSINDEADLTAIGRIGVRQNLIRLMSDRLRMTELAARRPELTAAPVTAPLFIAGQPRSGTTFLHRTMARDHAWNSIPLWELLHPIPPTGFVPGSGPDPRVKSGERALRTALRVVPAMRKIHETDNDEPDEELPLLATGHASASLGCGHYPAYTQWYTTADHTGGYRLLKQFIQALQLNRPAGTRWLLKSPSHLEMLHPLLTVFDDATVVLTHRDPISSIVSLSALDHLAYGILLRRPDPHWIGRVCVDFMERSLRSMVRYRDSEEGIANRDRFVDVPFAELTGDPIATVRRISTAADHEPDEVALLAMKEYAQKLGGHRSKQHFTVADFGLDKAELRERFAFYYERFDVPIEPDR